MSWGGVTAPLTLVTVCLGNYSRATHRCKVFINEMQDFFSAVTYSHLIVLEEMEKAISHNKESTGDPTGWGIRALWASEITQSLYSTQIWYHPLPITVPPGVAIYTVQECHLKMSYFFLLPCGDFLLFSSSSSPKKETSLLTFPRYHTIGSVQLLKTVFYF